MASSKILECHKSSKNASDSEYSFMTLLEYIFWYLCIHYGPLSTIYRELYIHFNSPSVVINFIHKYYLEKHVKWRSKEENRGLERPCMLSVLCIY